MVEFSRASHVVGSPYSNNWEVGKFQLRSESNMEFESSQYYVGDKYVQNGHQS